VTNKVTQTKLVMQELLLCYTSKKVTSKLHKQNYLQEQLHKHNIYESKYKLV
jgi:hypothetical protein